MYLRTIQSVLLNSLTQIQDSWFGNYSYFNITARFTINESSKKSPQRKKKKRQPQYFIKLTIICSYKGTVYEGSGVTLLNWSRSGWWIRSLAANTRNGSLRKDILESSHYATSRQSQRDTWKTCSRNNTGSDISTKWPLEENLYLLSAHMSNDSLTKPPLLCASPSQCWKGCTGQIFWTSAVLCIPVLH